MGGQLPPFFLLLLFLAQFIWEIDWSGNRRYTESELNHYLQTLQIEEGIPKKRISCARLEEELRESFEDITWVSVRLHGTRLFIRLRESEVPVRQEVESGETCDLAAVSDARITSVVVRSGIPLVQAGDTVEKGQLLVSGTVPITDDGGEEISSYRVRADADIYGIRERVGEKGASALEGTADGNGKETIRNCFGSRNTHILLENSRIL